MQDTAGLIAELEQETTSGRFAMIALAVVFDDKQQLILGNRGTNFLTEEAFSSAKWR